MCMHPAKKKNKQTENRNRKSELAQKNKFSRFSVGLGIGAANVLVSHPSILHPSSTSPSIPLSYCLHSPIPIPICFFNMLLLRTFHPLLRGCSQADELHGAGFGGTKLCVSPWLCCLLPSLGWRQSRCSIRGVSTKLLLRFQSPFPAPRGVYRHLTQHPKPEASEEPATQSSAPIYEFFTSPFCSGFSKHISSGSCSQGVLQPRGPAAILLHTRSLSRCCQRWGP